MSLNAKRNPYAKKVKFLTLSSSVPGSSYLQVLVLFLFLFVFISRLGQDETCAILNKATLVIISHQEGRLVLEHRVAICEAIRSHLPGKGSPRYLFFDQLVLNILHCADIVRGSDTVTNIFRCSRDDWIAMRERPAVFMSLWCAFHQGLHMQFDRDQKFCKEPGHRNHTMMRFS